MINTKDLPIGCSAGYIYKTAIEDYDRTRARLDQQAREFNRNLMLEDLDQIEYEKE